MMEILRPRRAWSRIGIGIVVALAGCGDDGDSDGGVGAPGCDPGEEVGPDGACIPPASACAAGEIELLGPTECKAVGWTTCPTGFTTTPASDGPECVPVYAETCAAHERPELGSPACTPVGFTTCPAGFVLEGSACTDVLPDAPCVGATLEVLGEAQCQPVGDCNDAFPPAGATLFVDDSYTAGELDAAHFLTITAALTVAGAGDVVAVESGSYVEGLSAVPGVVVHGRCAGEVVVGSVSGTTGGFFASDPGTATLEGVTLTGHFRGVVASEGAEVHLRDVVLDDNTNVGILATQQSLVVVEDSVVRATQFDTGTTFGYGVDVNMGSRVELRRSSLSENHQVGIQIVGSASTIVLERSVVRATLPKPNGDFGVALLVRQSASAELTESVLADNREAGVVALDSGTSLAMTDSVVRDTAIGAPGYGRGLDIAGGAEATVTRSSVLRSHEIAVAATDPGTSITLDQVTVADTRTDADGVFGSGVYAGPGTTVSLTDTAVVGSGDEAVLAQGPAASVQITRSLLARASGEGPTFGRGISAYGGAQVGIATSAFADNHEAGVLASEGAVVTLTDALVLRTTANGAGVKGRGVIAIQGASATLERVAVAAATEFGLFADGAGSIVTATDVSVRGTLPRPSDQRFGRGIGVQTGAIATVLRADVSDNHEVGIFVSGAGSTIDLREVTIARTAALPAGTGGIGLAVQTGGIGTVTASVIADNRVTGVLAAGAGTSVTVSESLVSRTVLGGEGGFELAHGATAVDGSIMTLHRSILRDCEGVGATFAASAGTIDACVLTGNRIGLNVQDASLVEVDAVPSLPSPLQVVVSSTTLFADNEAKLGAEILPLPALLPDVAP